MRVAKAGTLPVPTVGSHSRLGMNLSVLEPHWMTMGTDDWRLRRDDVVSLRLKFNKRRFQKIDDNFVPVWF
jgi:hypothetical protein